MIEDHARARGRRIDRFEGRSVAKPLFQQKGGSSTVEATAPIACQAMALSCCPGAAVLIHPGQGKSEGIGQTQAVATAMVSLGCRCTSGIQRQADHQSLHPPVQAKPLQNGKIGLKSPAMQRWQWGHRDSERITPGQTDPATANIQAQNGTGPRHLSGDRGWAMAVADPGDAVGQAPDQRIG